MLPIVAYKHIFILNPFDKNKDLLKQIINEEAQLLSLNYEIIDLESLAHIEAYVRKIPNQVNYMVHSVGDDNLNNVIINGMAYKKSVLNLFFNNNSEELKKEKKANLGKINNRYFYNGVTIGIDANIKSRVREITKSTVNNPKVNFTSSIKELLKFEPIKLNINNEELLATNLFIGPNGSFSNIKFKKDSNYRSNNLDYGIINNLNLFPLVKYLISKELKIKKKIDSFIASKMYIKTEEPVIANYDGMELYSDEFDVSVEPKALNLYIGDPLYISNRVNQKIKKQKDKMQ